MMQQWIYWILGGVLIVAAVHLVLYLARFDRVRLIGIDDDFTVRYPRVFLFLCLVFYILVCVLALDLVVWHKDSPVQIIVVVALAALGLPFLLLSVVWKIHVRAEYIILVGMWGAKRQIYYKDIRKVVLTKSALILNTTLKTYRFTANLVYREYFLKRMQMNGVEIERFDIE